MKAYTVEYKEYETANVKCITLLAKNKEDALDKVWDVFENMLDGGHPYSFWIAGVTYQNGNYHRFNTHEGKRI